eukprot:5383472-Amphidinium_carterae.1
MDRFWLNTSDSNSYYECVSPGTPVKFVSIPSFILLALSEFPDQMRISTLRAKKKSTHTPANDGKATRQIDAT